MELGCVLFLLSVCVLRSTAEGTLGSRFVLEPYDFLFDSAVDAYQKADWYSVILNMEKAIRNRATVRKVKVQCRLSCANQTSFSDHLAGVGVPIPGVGSLEDLGFFQKILKRADCVSSCELEKLGSPTMHQVTEDVKQEFSKRSPYNYLQVAYFKVNKLDKAVAAANTFFQANPDHVEMRQNLEYYRMMAGVQEEDFKDLEARTHMAEFLLGKRYYSDDLFELAAEHVELAAKEYFTADQECRVLCEGSYNYDGYNYMEYSADLFQSITDHYMQVLNCKQHCAVELASHISRNEPFKDFLPSHFNYLQFSYYNSEKYEQAIECAKTFLLFHPDDEVMNQNLAYYSVVLGEDKAKTIPAREEVKQYIKQSILEKELLYFGYEAFGITFVDPDSWTPEDVMPKKLREKQKADRETAARITEEIGNLMKEIENMVEEKKKDSSDMSKLVTPQEGASLLHDDIRLTMTAQQLNGSQRVLLDAVITDDECRELQQLSNAAALKGDGYRGQSPHSASEMFQGVTVLKAVKLGQEGKVPLKSARLYAELSEKVRKVLESYFKLETPLYFSYTHLVCRSAIEEKQADRKDLSHDVHADNCLLVSEMNECIKEPPAYTHRDYSAILYLNDDFEGGDFFFTELDAKTVTAEVRPRCGRVVGFGAGKENPHGVRAVTRGQRCAVALWFTLDPSHEEKERIQAQDMLQMFSSPVNQEFMKNDATDASHTTTPETPVQADQPKADQVPADQPKADQVQADQPKADQVQADQPKADQVQADQEKTDQVQTDQVQADQPKADQVQADSKEEDKSIGKQQKSSADAKADKPASLPKDKAGNKKAIKKAADTKGKAAPKAKSQAAAQGKTKTKTQAKQAAETKGAKPSGKKTVAAPAKKKDSRKSQAAGATATATATATDSQSGKEEL
ncbi:prolyl 3-hydroxylase 1 isoform X6 [Nelusetta ayraudi]|uniref:prolyl 3-hydroxylase 1 isoform X6 n=1 Tax=Nelusetta ayraudi TaxID=303726 RepID=UPI003F6F8AF4